MGPWQTVYNWFWRWARNGTLSTLVRRVRVIADAVEELDREVSVDSSITRAHQHAAGAHHRTTSVSAHAGASGFCGGQIEPDDQAIGRARSIMPR